MEEPIVSQAARTAGAETELARERVEALSVYVYADRAQLGRAAGNAVAERLRILLGSHDRISAVFAAAPSQDEFLHTLAAAPSIDWSRVTAFQVDEYVGLCRTAPGSCARYISEHLFDLVRPGRVHFIDGLAEPLAECRRYAELLASGELHLACLGIGENGHLAFNEPGVTRFDDVPVRVVETDLVSRQQQANDGCFPTLADVPAQAVTLTIPTLMQATEVHCIVPGARKRDAVRRTLRGEITPDCPASILRRHPDACLYLDRDSYSPLDFAEPASPDS